MQTEKTKAIAAGVMMVAAVSLLYFSLHQSPPKVEPRPAEGLGQVLAEEAAKLLGGGRVTLITWDLTTLKNPTAELQMKSFYKAARKANLTLASTNAIKLDPLRLVRVPSGDFLEILKKQSDSDVIVSFLGPPLLNSEQRSKLGDRKPRVVALCSGGMPRQIDLKELFAQNLLQVGIISRPAPAPEPPPSSNPRDWFDHFYQVITSANLSDLPAPTNSVSR